MAKFADPVDCIRALNDTLRQTGIGGESKLSQGVASLDEIDRDLRRRREDWAFIIIRMSAFSEVARQIRACSERQLAAHLRHCVQCSEFQVGFRATVVRFAF